MTDQSNARVLVLYHGDCDDGFAAAWAVRHALGANRVECVACIYGQEPPTLEGRDVIIVDFSYKAPVMRRIAAVAKSLLVLDHHKTAAADLAGMPPAGINVIEWADKTYSPAQGKIGVLFDMERSGAGIAWDFFHPDETGMKRPSFIDYIEDRDLWRKKLAGGDQFTIALRSYPQDMQTWDYLVNRGAVALREEGRPIWRYYQERIKELGTHAYMAFMQSPKGDRVPWSVAIANAPYFAASELAGELCAHASPAIQPEFGACFFQRRDGLWQYSLRSRDDFDVSEVAKLFGGGGHKNAAGFQVPELVHKPVKP